jgi:hypothetical protein
VLKKIRAVLADVSIRTISGVIAGAILAGGVGTYLTGLWPTIADIASKIGSLVVASTIVPNWLLTPISLLAASGVFILSKASYRHIAGQYRHNTQHNTLRIVPEGSSLFCHTGMSYNKPATSLCGTWYITNITDHSVSLLAARIKSPRKAAGTEASIKESILQPDGSPQRIPIQFLVYPAVHQEGKPFKATIAFVDQYYNEHILKNLLFKVPPHILFRSE